MLSVHTAARDLYAEGWDELLPVSEGDEGNYRFFKVSVEMR